MSVADPFSIALRRFVFSQQAWAPDLGELRAKRVRALLRHAIELVPLYRELYRTHAISIETISGPDDLWRLPAVSKLDYIRTGPKGYVDERQLPNLSDLYTQTTSGSLGTALTMYAEPTESLFHLAGFWAGWIGAGVHVHDRLFMMGAPYLSKQIDPFHSVFIPVQMPMDEIVAQFRRFRPTVVIGLVESIALLAVELRRQNLPEREEVRLLFPFGQTYSAQLRGMVESGFKAETFVLYGSAEGGLLGHECEQHNGLHVPMGRVVVQIAQTGRPNEPAPARQSGEVILTALMRGTTPFIRYRLHDAAALDPAPCPCGRSAPRITNLEGRVQDFLVATDGRWVGPSSVAIEMIVGQPNILDYRILQESPGRVHVSLVLASGFGDADRKRIEGILQRRLGPVVTSFDSVSEIPRDPSGKRRRIFRAFDLPDGPSP